MGTARSKNANSFPGFGLQKSIILQHSVCYVQDLLVPPPASSNWSIRFKRNKTLPIFNMNIILMICNGPKMTYIETAQSEYKNSYN